MLPVRIYESPIVVKQGEQKTINLVLKIDGIVVNLSNCSVFCNIRTRSQLLIASPVVTVNNPLTGSVSIELESYQTALPGEYFYDFRIKNILTNTVKFTSPSLFRIYPVATVDDSVIPIPPVQNEFEEITISTNGQTVFVLSRTPDPLNSQVFFNGEKMNYAESYIFNGNILNWIDSHVSIDLTDNFEIYY